MPAFENDELEISLAHSANRRAQSRPADQASTSSSEDNPNEAEFPTPGKKDEQRIGQYQVLSTLGQGSFGKVKLAVHRVTNQQVALKIIARKKLISRDMAGRVEREIEYLQLLRHPHIIKLYTVIKTPTEIIMVLEYAGGELFDYIVQMGKMGETEARRFFQQVICAVEYCHRHKIVHRDLKPENLLLDEHLNVKIADFGLSNIMTDGNFLKTSCGSPNYAAPEVVSGKLYAGPEVDVWSCGVILYVLLVGRLPFDADLIPTLFARIAKGQYHVPNYMTAGAAALIKRMLSVNPTHRATIEEIRSDPWFVVDLPAYLQPPVDEFMDTGIDPSKAVSPETIAPYAPPAVQARLYDQVTEKISKTMGYGIHDVHEALAANEPSAIKDAYLIVRENKLMQENPKLADVDGKLMFQASSPPAWDDGTSFDRSGFESEAEGAGGTNGLFPATRRNPLVDAISPRSSSSVGTDRLARPYVSKIGVLPSSLPEYHCAFMRTYKSDKKASEDMSTTHSEVSTPQPQTEAEKAETKIRLNPHSRSQLKLADAANKPSGLTPMPPPAKKSRGAKWQFGIRSRNQPLEAIGCIYRALQKLGACWLIDDQESRPVSRESIAGSGEEEEGTDYSASPINSSNASATSLHQSGSINRNQSTNRPHFYPFDAHAYYSLPADPWVLRVRWRKGSKYSPEIRPSTSSTVSTTATSLGVHSAAIDFARQPQPVILRSPNSKAETSTALPVSSPHRPEPGEHIESIMMHLDIQLYDMDGGVFLVDFKCAGYETPDGVLWEEKDITSPFPFLELASRLIIQLAEAD